MPADRSVRWKAPGRGLGLAFLGALVLLALAAPWAATDPNLQHDVVATRFLAPLTTDPYGLFHLLGTDRLGRDVWARLLWGARISLGVGFLAILLSAGIGALIGLLGAAGQAWTGRILMGFTDLALALPRIVLLLLLAALWQPSAGLVVVVLGMTGWMPIARLVAVESRSLLAQPFVESAVALGAPRWRVLLRHIFPNVQRPILVASVLGMANAVTLEAGLSFLGLGVQPPVPSWGSMIASGRDTMIEAPWVGLVPGVALVATVIALALVADREQPTSPR